MMDEEDIKIFIDGLNLKLDVYSFDFLAPIPLPFVSLGVVNRVSNKKFRSLNLPVGYGKPLKDFLKRVQEKGVKRKLNTPCNGKPSDKLLKSDKHQSNISGTSSAKDELNATSGQQFPLELEHLEEEQMLECENDEVNFNEKKFKEALEHLNEFLDKNNLDRLKEVLQNSREASELEIGLGIHVFSKLAGEACTSKKNLPVCPCGCQDKLLHHENMWIGSESTWYGELDILSGNLAKGDTVSVTVNVTTEIQADETDMDDLVSFEDRRGVDETGEEGSESPGDMTNVEEKCIGQCDELNQVIAQAVTFAFTEYNRHNTYGNCIPSILIDKEGFQYVIYSPSDDILLVSNHMNYASEENFEAATGFRPFVVLWIILNHRLFFKKCPDFRKRFVKSGFHEKMDNLQHFQNLFEYSENITVKQNLHFVNDTPNTIGIAAMDWFLDKKGSF